MQNRDAPIYSISASSDYSEKIINVVIKFEIQPALVGFRLTRRGFNRRVLK
jgi:hypothetical protein